MTANDEVLPVPPGWNRGWPHYLEESSIRKVVRSIGTFTCCNGGCADAYPAYIGCVASGFYPIVATAGG